MLQSWCDMVGPYRCCAVFLVLGEDMLSAPSCRLARILDSAKGAMRHFMGSAVANVVPGSSLLLGPLDACSRRLHGGGTARKALAGGDHWGTPVSFHCGRSHVRESFALVRSGSATSAVHDSLGAQGASAVRGEHRVVPGEPARPSGRPRSSIRFRSTGGESPCAAPGAVDVPGPVGEYDVDQPSAPRGHGHRDPGMDGLGRQVSGGVPARDRFVGLVTGTNPTRRCVAHAG